MFILILMSITFRTAHEFFLGEKADVIVRRIAIISAMGLAGGGNRLTI